MVVGMTLGAFDKLTAVIFGKASRAERDAVIELHVVADFTGLAYDDTSSIIDEKVRADAGFKFDVDACHVVGPLRHRAWGDQCAFFLETMRELLNGGGFQIMLQEFTHRWNRMDELFHDRHRLACRSLGIANAHTLANLFLQSADD
jgi:hypothetical protein